MKNKILKHLIDDWRSFFKFWSVRFDILAGICSGLLYAWDELPEVLKAEIPHEYMRYITLVLFIASLVARIIKQPKLKANNES